MFDNLFAPNLYGKIMASQPPVFQSIVLAGLVTCGQGVGVSMALFQTASALTGKSGNNALAGPAAPAQQGQVSSAVGTGTSILNGANTIQSLMNAGSNQLTTAKRQLTGISAAAVGEGLLVNPVSGTVTFGPGAYAAIASVAPYGSAAKTAFYTQRVTFYTRQIWLVLFQTRASDVIVAASLLNTGLQLVSLFVKPGSSATTPPTTTPPPPDPVPLPTGTAPGLTLPKTGGTTLSGAGPLGANVAAGTAGLSMPQPATLAGSAGAGAGSASVLRGMPAVDESGARGGAMMGAGGGAGGKAGRSERQRDAKNWSLYEDDDPVADTDVADTDGDGVLR